MTFFLLRFGVIRQGIFDGIQDAFRADDYQSIDVDREVTEILPMRITPYSWAAAAAAATATAAHPARRSIGQTVSQARRGMQSVHTHREHRLLCHMPPPTGETPQTPFDRWMGISTKAADAAESKKAQFVDSMAEENYIPVRSPSSFSVFLPLSPATGPPFTFSLFLKFRSVSLCCTSPHSSLPRSRRIYFR